MLFAKANASEDAISVVSPSTTVGLTPMRAVSQPPGRAPRNVPAGYAATRTPAPVLDRSKSAA